MLSHTYSVICYSALGEDMLVLDFEGGYAQEAVQFSFFFFYHRHNLYNYSRRRSEYF